MKFNFEAIEKSQRDPLCVWLDRLIAVEALALAALLGYCLAHTF